MEQCRLCLSFTNQRVNVTDNLELINKIKEVSTIEITANDIHTKFVCLECIRKIENWYSFKIVCLNSKLFLDSHQRNIDLKVLPNTENNKEETISIQFDAEDNTNNDKNNKNFIEIKDEEITTTEADNIYTCEFCNEEFNYFIEYLDHQETHDGKVIWNCSKCKETFTNRINLLYHERTHKFPCHICGTYVLRQSMKLHLNKHTNKFKCKLCDLTFTSSSLLQAHIDIIHKNIKQYFCETCGKKFGTKSSLTLHLKIHSDLKQYKCDQCSYAGKTSIALRIHVSKHENGTYICEYCPSVFKSNRNLKDHLRRVHLQVRKYACDICSMKFALRYLVEQHKRTHTGIHPYKCTKCNRTFARSDGLKEHLQTHNRSRETFKCQPCAKEFKTKRGLRRHNCTLAY